MLFFLTSICFVACQQPKKHYFEASPEVDSVKKSLTAFLNQDWVTFRSLYSDSAKIAINTSDKEKFINNDQHLESEKEAFTTFTDIKFQDVDYKMVITDKGEKWVLMWYNAIAKTKGGVDVKFPAHETFRFVEGKIVFQHNYYDNLPICLALQPAGSVGKN
jgi:hypothetical protein